MNKFDEMRAAVAEAKETLRAADATACLMASLLIGRLRRCYRGDLIALKRELRDFNIKTGRWND